MTDCKLYLLTPPKIYNLKGFAEDFEAVLSSGAGLVAFVQIRLKQTYPDESEGKNPDALTGAVYRHLAPIARHYGARIIINDRPDLAAALGADGVHLGQNDMPCREARACLGKDKIIGITCHASKNLAISAATEGADYVAFGAFYPTATKPVHNRASPDILADWSKYGTRPCIAIGGITPEKAGPLCQAGADFLAVCSGVWSYPQGPEKAILAFRTVMEVL